MKRYQETESTEIDLKIAENRKQLSEKTVCWKKRCLGITTVRRRLVAANLHGCRPRLTQKQRQEHHFWARKYKNWSVYDWSKIIWSDKSNIEIFNPPGSQYVRRRKGEEFHPHCQAQRR